ncbi:MAG TPA: helix-turn-helix domain-containing protein [Intrasporangium sp.]|uniref:helix-turn-helix transcriptional regulator n=1 Tax=Intrasporangium sp. TaxID=1925024 RepID=UPI002D79CBBC|nr:helix-turn-helix domain-containing protein [Intrasporangium sp.]HET7399171.1 helix-turn-helix domain-containing protein [Intrasporangium sp.]
MRIDEGWGPEPTRDETGAAAALSPQRRRVLDALGPDPLPVAAIAARLGLHLNTAREHLEGLAASGLVVRTRQARAGRGRPAWAYAVHRAAVSRAAGEYAALASLLAQHVASQPGDVAADMSRLGRQWGRSLASRPAGTSAQPADDEPGEPDSPSEEAAAEAALVGLLDDLGFAPEVAPDAVRLRQCPMLDVARQRPDVVCAVHLGLAQGALEEAGGSAAGMRLEPFAEPGACLLRMR